MIREDSLFITKNCCPCFRVLSILYFTSFFVVLFKYLFFFKDACLQAHSRKQGCRGHRNRGWQGNRHRSASCPWIQGFPVGPYSKLPRQLLPEQPCCQELNIMKKKKVSILVLDIYSLTSVLPQCRTKQHPYLLL